MLIAVFLLRIYCFSLFVTGTLSFQFPLQYLHGFTSNEVVYVAILIFVFVVSDCLVIFIITHRFYNIMQRTLLCEDRGIHHTMHGT
jgi:hypothetical protein